MNLNRFFKSVVLGGLFLLTLTTHNASALDSWQIQLRCGTPTMVYSGTPDVPESYQAVSPLFYYNNGYDTAFLGAPHVKHMAQAGFCLYTMDCSVNSAHNDYYQLDERIEALLTADPQAKILMRLYVWQAPQWGERYPDEIVQLADGTKYYSPSFAPVSYASQVWIKQSLADIDRFYDFLKAHDLYDKVIGVIISGAGATGEWNLWYYQPSPDHPKERQTPIADYSPAMQKYYRGYLQKKYSVIDSLNAAYQSSYASFDELSIPSEEILCPQDTPWFRENTASDKMAQDYLLAYSDAVCQSMLIFARHIRQITGGHRLIASWFAAHPQAAYGGSWGRCKNGYLLERDILASDAIDMIITPPLYITTFMGGSAMMQAFPDVWASHGKMCIYEMDQPTHILLEKYPDRESWLHGGLRSTYRGTPELPRVPTTLQESQAVLRRAAGYTIIKGMATQYWDMEARVRQAHQGVSYDNPAILEEFARIQRVTAESLEKPRDSVSEIVVIFDPTDMLWAIPRNQDYFVDLVMRGSPREVAADSQLENLARCGSPYDVQEIQDWDKLKPYKLYIFLNAWALSDIQIHAIHQRLEHQKAHAVWFYAPGYIHPETGASSIERIARTTGFRVEITGPDKIEMVNHPQSKPPFDSAFRTFTMSEVSPRFKIVDLQSAQVWGKDFYSDAVLAATQTMPGGWTSTYSIGAPLTTAMWAALAELAGCHRYTKPGCIVYANRSYLMIHGIHQGSLCVSLPESAAVHDVFNAKTISDSTNQIDLNESGIFTYLFQITPFPK